MTGRLCTVAEATELLGTGRAATVAGDERLLAQLPAGTWIGGTIPYFMTADGGQTRTDAVWVEQLSEQVVEAKVASYPADRLAELVTGAYPDGYSVVILPSGSPAHERYAADAPDFPGLFDQPVVGWVAGVHLDDLGRVAPRTFAGAGEASSTTDAVVLHARLREGVLAQADIVNLFVGADGPALTFDQTGFAQDKVLVDGVPQSFGAYLTAIGHDVRRPLVADYFGTPVNVSFQSVDENGEVVLYAPVFSGITYRLAASIGDYATELAAQLPPASTHPAFACNCILNYLYGELEGRTTGDIVGPVTFGEVAYQLLNQTVVYLTLHE